MFNYPLILFLSFIITIRLLPVLLGKGFLHRYSYDSGWYFLFSKYFYFKNRYQKNILSDKLLIFNKIETPQVYPYLLSFFNFFLTEKSIKNYFNVFIDILFIIFLYFILQIFGFTQLKIYLLICIYLLSPIFYSITNLGPRLYAVTPRLFSEIVFSVLLFSYYGYEFLSNYYILLFLFLLSLILYLSKFSLQVVILLLFPAMILNKSFDLLLLSLLTLFLNVVFSKTLRFSFKNQLEHLKWYFEMTKKGAYITNRNSLKFIFKFQDIKHWAKSFYKINSFTSTFIKFLPFFILILFLEPHSYPFFENIAFVSLILFFLINTKYLIYLGEAERYIVHALFPILVLMGFYFTDEILLYFIIFYLIFFSIESFYIFKIYNRHNFVDFDESFNFLREIKESRNILLNPLNALSGFEVAASTHHNIFNSSVGFRKNLKNVNIILEEYPVINLKNLKFFVENYKIDLLVLRKDYYESISENINCIIDSLFDEEFISSNGLYKIYSKK